MPSHYTHGPDYLDKDKKKKKKFSYKTEKAKLDSQMSNYHKEMERLKQERLKKEARKKQLAEAKRLAEAEDKKRSNYKIHKHIAVSTNKKAVELPERKAVSNTKKAVKLKHKAKKK